MAASRPYKQIGVLLPIERYSDENRVLRDSTVARGDEFMNDGFLFVKALQMGSTDKCMPSGKRKDGDQSIFLVQSVSTGELFANKLIEAAWDPINERSLPPPELRVSTYSDSVGDPNIDSQNANGGHTYRKGALPDLPCFNNIRFWQELDPNDPTRLDSTVYSLFFQYVIHGQNLTGNKPNFLHGRFCNGGTLRELMDAYNKREIAIPEHFIWYIASIPFTAHRYPNTFL
jgi:hypothetical protein